MTGDDLGLFARQRTGDEDHDQPGDQPGRPGREADEERPAGRRRRRRPVVIAVVVVVLAIVAGGAYYGLQQVLGIGDFANYSGTGESDVVVQIQPGSVSSMGNQLQQAGVVASVRAFTKAGADDQRVKSVQPGFYVLKTKMSGTAAVTRLVDPQARVGQLEIRGGRQLDDLTGSDGKVTPGILSMLAKASCAKLNGKSTCLPVEQIRQIAETGDPAALGVPPWAIQDVAKADAKHRLEGLISPGVYDVMPGATPAELLKSVLAASAARMQAAGMPSIAADTGFTPYQVLIVASLVEREAIKVDFGKVARVTYNRLALPMALQYDSTVNYVLDRPTIRTRPEDRAKAGPYNTYENNGLPPTPISSPSTAALAAAAKADAGKWLYFVKCQKDPATSCFAETLQQHQANVADAQARGVY